MLSRSAGICSNGSACASFKIASLTSCAPQTCGFLSSSGLLPGLLRGNIQALICDAISFSFTAADAVSTKICSGSFCSLEATVGLTSLICKLYRPGTFTLCFNADSNGLPPRSAFRLSSMLTSSTLSSAGILSGAE